LTSRTEQAIRNLVEDEALIIQTRFFLLCP
jgi:hypothetical protein